MQQMTPEEARADLKDKVDAIQGALGGVWTNHDSPVAEGCDVPSESGFYYQYGRARVEPIVDYSTASKAAVDHWTALGYEIETATYRPDLWLVTATAPNGTTIYLSLDRDRDEIIAEGPCNEGNWGDVSLDDVRRVKEQRRNTPSPEPTPGE